MQTSSYQNGIMVPYQQKQSSPSAYSQQSAFMPQCSHSSSNYDSRDDSIYSMTPFIGDAAAAVVSPSNQSWMIPSPTSINTVGANQSSVRSPSSPSAMHQQQQPRQVQFDFPPELAKSSPLAATTITSESSYSSRESHKENRLVEYNANVGAMVVTSPSSSNYLIKVPQSQHAHGSDAVHPEKKRMKKQRKQRTVAGVVGGMVVGGKAFHALGGEVANFSYL